jgi:hypothetical protein
MIYTPTPMRNGKIRSFHSKQSQLYTPKNMIYALTLTPQVHPVVPLHQVIWRRRAPRGPRGPKRAIFNRTETWGFQWRKHGDKSIFTFFFATRIGLGFLYVFSVEFFLDFTNTI